MTASPIMTSKIKRYLGYTALIVTICWFFISIYIRNVDVSADVERNFITE